MYCPIQYAKFAWLSETIRDNPFHADHFFWIDAGLLGCFGRKIATSASGTCKRTSASSCITPRP